MLKEFFAAKILIIGILDPARAEHIVAEIVHVLQAGDAGHQPRRQRRTAGNVRIDRAKRGFQKRPIDGPRELRQRMVKIDDLSKPRAENVALASLSALFRKHPPLRLSCHMTMESRFAAGHKYCRKSEAISPETGNLEYLHGAKNLAQANACAFFTGDKPASSSGSLEMSWRWRGRCSNERVRYGMAACRA